MTGPLGIRGESVAGNKKVWAKSQDLQHQAGLWNSKTRRTRRTQDNTACFLLGKTKSKQEGPGTPCVLLVFEPPEGFDLSLEGSIGRAVERASAWDKQQSSVSGWFRALRPELESACRQWEVFRGQSQATKG